MAGPPTTFLRFENVGTTPHRHEAEGIEWLRAALPTYGPFGGYALFSFQSDNGKRYEIDAMVLTAHCLFVLELKAWRGRLIDGDVRYLVTQSPQRGREVADHPLPLLETKTKSLMSRARFVARRLGSDVEAELRNLRFEPLVWLTHADGTSLGRNDAALAHVVVGRQNIGDALRQAQFPGAYEDLRLRETSHATLKALRRVMQSEEFGLRRVEKPRTVLDGRFELKELIEEGDDYQDHWIRPATGPACRVRSYLVPKSDRAFVERLDRRVEREAQTLTRLGEHPKILALSEFDPKGPLGPALVFRGFDGLSLGAFLKQRRDAQGKGTISLDQKLGILRDVADALTFCHRNDIVHGAVSPEAVLVGTTKEDRLDVRLTRFALATTADPTSDGTRLFTRLAGASANLFEAPEVARGGQPTAASDMFSLGALAYLLLADVLPAATPTELVQRVERDLGLLISAVRDDLFPGNSSVDRVIWEVTCVSPSERTVQHATPVAFVRALEDALTVADPPPIVAAPPVSPAKEADPLDATTGDVLGGLLVLTLLGSGGTARVFKVENEEGDTFALKVPLSDAHDDRIAREGEVLKRLRHLPGVDRVAHLVEVKTIGGRTCLLMQFAGDRTLAEEIRTEGALSLDYARRWGEDLLTALRSLEEAGIQHRDIKPANIGLTSGPEKKKKRLLLFDFSLSERSPDEIGAGTPAYKDPELLTRGRWDDAADRWAAAIALVEMFTGSRPAPLPVLKAGVPAVRVEAERIDVGVRDGLVGFFNRALRCHASERYATADDMRTAFLRALIGVSSEDTDDEKAVQAVDLQGLGPEAQVGTLQLSTRTHNALDRLGIYTLHEVAQLSPNRINGVRGVGAKTARSLAELVKAVRKHLDDSGNEAPAPFLRGFNGARRALEEEAASGGLSAPLVARLVDAGIADTVSLAGAPSAQVKNLVARAKRDGAPENLAALKEALERLVDADRPPTTLGAAVELVAPRVTSKTAAWRQRVRFYLGLDAREGFPLHGSMSELARAEEKTRALVSIDIGKARAAWRGAEQTHLATDGSAPAKARELVVLERVFRAVFGVLSTQAGVVSLPRAAAAVLDAFPPEADLTPDATKRGSEALVRAITELDVATLGGPEGARLRFKRPTNGAGDVLVALDEPALEVAAQLGETADALVEGEAVVTEAAAAERLRQAVSGVARIPPERAAQLVELADRPLVGLAAATATRARVSARGELYPAGLPPERALLLTAASLAGVTTFDELGRRVRARYPESAALPEDPAARAALASKLPSFRLSAAGDSLEPRDVTIGSSGTELGLRGTTDPLPQIFGTASVVLGPVTAAATGTVGAGAAVPLAPRKERATDDVVGATALRIFDDELVRARRDGAFRVLLWRGDRFRDDRTARGAPEATHVAGAIAARLGGVVQRADALLLRAAEALAAEQRMVGGLALAIGADDAGPQGEDWLLLVRLMSRAAERVGDTLLQATAPQVLINLGLLGRYDQLAVIARLAVAHRTRGPSAPAHPTFVVLPVVGAEGAVVEVAAEVASHVGAVAGTCVVPVPGVLPSEILVVPPTWRNQNAGPRKASNPNFPAQR